MTPKEKIQAIMDLREQLNDQNIEIVSQHETGHQSIFIDGQEVQIDSNRIDDATLEAAAQKISTQIED